MSVGCAGHRVAPATPLQVGEEEEVICPLTGLQYEVSSDSIAATIVVEQQFTNVLTNESLEVKYQHPIDPTCVITDCSMTINNRTIKCSMKPKDDAHDDYDDALALGQTALLAETTDDALVFNLGIVPPSTVIIVKVTYIVEVVVQSGSQLKVGTITIPQSLIPAPHEASAFAPNLDVAHASVTDVECKVNLEPSKSVVLEVISKPDTERRDVVVNVTQPSGEAFDVKEIIVAPTNTGAPSEHYSISIPVSGQFLESEGSPPQLLFLLDCSMQPMQFLEARQCLIKILKGMSSSSNFNIIPFGGKHDPLFKESNSGAITFKPADEKTVAEATVYVMQLVESSHPCNLDAPIKALQKSKSDGIQCIVVTNGDVKESETAFKKFFELAEDVRVTSVGVGDNCNRSFIQSLARYTGGRAFFVKNAEQESSKLKAIALQCTQPILRDLTLNIIAEIDGFKPCFAVHRECHLSIVPADSRELLYGFAPDYFEPDQLNTSCLNLEGGFIFECSPCIGYAISDTHLGSIISEQKLKEHSLEPTPGVKAAIVKHSLQSGMLKESLGDLFPSACEIKKEDGQPIKVELTNTGKATFGDSKNAYSRSEISIKALKSVQNIALAQPDGSEKLIPLAEGSLATFKASCLEYMPSAALTYAVDSFNEVHRSYTVSVQKDKRINILTAAKRIQEIEDMQRIGLFGDELTPEAVRLSTTYNILSKHTAFIAVDEEGVMQPVKKVTKIDVEMQPVSTITSRSVLRMEPDDDEIEIKGQKRMSKKASSPSAGLSLGMSFEAAEEDVVPPPAAFMDGAPPPPPPMPYALPHQPEGFMSGELRGIGGVGPILSLQLPNGAWVRSPELAALLHLPEVTHDDMVTITTHVLHHLETYFAHLRSEWFHAAERAQAFLTGQTVPMSMVPPVFGGMMGSFQDPEGDAL